MKGIYEKVEKYLAKPNRKRVEVNLKKINQIAKDGDLVVVPGNVIGDFKPDKKFDLASLKISKTSLSNLNGKYMTIEEWKNSGKKGRFIV